MIPGYVLGGGASRRMGRDKARVLLDGVPLAIRQVHTLLQGGCASATLVGRDPGLRALGVPLLLEPGFEADPPPDRPHHPLHGVAAALAHAGAGRVIIAPVDLVGLRPEHVSALLARGAPCVARADGHVHPLLAVISASEAARAAALAAEGGAAFGLTGHLPPVDLPADALRDANRPEDLR